MRDWKLQQQNARVENAGLTNGVKGMESRLGLHGLRRMEVKTAKPLN